MFTICTKHVNQQRIYYKFPLFDMLQFVYTDMLQFVYIPYYNRWLLFSTPCNSRTLKNNSFVAWQLESWQKAKFI